MITVKVKRKFTWEGGRGFVPGDVTQLPNHAVEMFEQMDPPAVERISAIKETNLPLGNVMRNAPLGSRVAFKMPERD